MDGFTLIDAGVVLIILVSGLLAYSRGLVREVLAIAGWVIAGIAAFTFAPTVDPIIRELPVLRDIIGTSCQLSILAAFSAVFAVALILMSFFTPLFAQAVQSSAIGPIDSGFGFLFGIVRGVLIVAVGFIIYDQVTGGEGVIMVDDAASRVFLADATQAIRDMIPTEIPSGITDRYEQLTGRCAQ
ncbi:membrane protein required for colicin V production [Rubricella aquisinus]|uniref:Membrane protein required for colicin V production n=1 Tax=Rubricella aquisinus TaxID=2028108 RepID=A0A840WZD8_9RHOB|nr:CvpA family protein [Rubricella aquisinus]MBB5516510.1 membrane protein required for colicin V production [Rubricella aquisinus]